MSAFVGKHILIIIENLPAPFDRRVWQEAQTLKKQGADVSIICPQMKGYTEKYECLDGIEIYRHPLPIEGRNALTYFIEYVTALWWEFLLAFKVYRRKKFHVIHGCNPPDLIFLTALPYKLRGVKYVFDHHDINPELYLSKFNKKGLFYWLMLKLEYLTFRVADYSIATNESYRKIAIDRGKMNPDKVEVIRSGPSLERLKIVEPVEKYKKGRKYLVGYVGVIGEQEGLDLLLEAIEIIVSKRQDVQFAIVGGGTYLDTIKNLAVEKNISDFVDFYGRVPDRELLEILNTADVCVNPDKPTPMNDLSTMNKIMEYMALGKPIVQFDLKEGRYSAQEASLYAKNTDVGDFAEKINHLLNNEEIRIKMGNYGRDRVVNTLSWQFEEKKLKAFYNRVLSD